MKLKTVYNLDKNFYIILRNATTLLIFSIAWTVLEKNGLNTKRKWLLINIKQKKTKGFGKLMKNSTNKENFNNKLQLKKILTLLLIIKSISTIK